MAAVKTPKQVPLPPGQPVPLAAAAEYLSLSSKTLLRAAEADRLVLIRFGRRVFVSFDELQRVARTGL